MKTVFLVIYLYARYGNSGGPELEIHEMPNVATCEAVGAAVLRLTAGNEEFKYSPTSKPHFECVPQL